MIVEFFDPKQTPIYLVILIQGGKWISNYIWNKGESTEALAGKVATLQKALAEGNARSSEKMTNLTNYLEERRSEFESLRADFMELSGEVRGARRDYPDDRRR